MPESGSTVRPTCSTVTPSVSLASDCGEISATQPYQSRRSVPSAPPTKVPLTSLLFRRRMPPRVCVVSAGERVKSGGATPAVLPALVRESALLSRFRPIFSIGRSTGPSVPGTLPCRGSFADCRPASSAQAPRSPCAVPSTAGTPGRTLASSYRTDARPSTSVGPRSLAPPGCSSERASPRRSRYTPNERSTGLEDCACIGS